jgi:hypothetical protein
MPLGSLAKRALAGRGRSAASAFLVGRHADAQRQLYDAFEALFPGGGDDAASLDLPTLGLKPDLDQALVDCIMCAARARKREREREPLHTRSRAAFTFPNPLAGPEPPRYEDDALAASALRLLESTYSQRRKLKDALKDVTLLERPSVAVFGDVHALRVEMSNLVFLTRTASVWGVKSRVSGPFGDKGFGDTMQVSSLMRHVRRINRNASPPRF